MSPLPNHLHQKPQTPPKKLRCTLSKIPQGLLHSTLHLRLPKQLNSSVNQSLLLSTLAPFILLILCLGISGCGAKKIDPYAPHETVLSIATEFQLLASGDPYREAPRADVSGQNIARATIVRLANYEALNPGLYQLEVEMLKARSYEWLGDYTLAEKLYDEVSQLNSPYKQDSLSRLQFIRELQNQLPRSSEFTTVDLFLAELKRSENALLSMANQQENSLLQSFALRAAEDVAVRRSELLASNRLLLENGDELAIDSLKEMISTFNESARSMNHALRLARLYRELAEEELRLNPPSGHRFDRNLCLAYLNESLDLIYRISQADGTQEKLIAQRELDTLLLIKEFAISNSR